MVNVVAINASPRQGRGHTGMILAPFLEGLQDEGATVDLFYASKLKVKPCSCGHFYCWYQTPGECVYKDSMTALYDAVTKAQILVVGSPVYSPAPGDLQNILNRFVPLLEPMLEFRHGRTRARLREDVQLEKVVLVAGTGWWEKENANLLRHVIEEFAENASITFSGALVRPHIYAMQTDQGVTEDGKRVLSAIRQGGRELIRIGGFKQETLDDISRPLLPREDYEEYLG